MDVSSNLSILAGGIRISLVAANSILPVIPTILLLLPAHEIRTPLPIGCWPSPQTSLHGSPMLWHAASASDSAIRVRLMKFRNYTEKREQLKLLFASLAFMLSSFFGPQNVGGTLSPTETPESVHCDNVARSLKTATLKMVSHLLHLYNFMVSLDLSDPYLHVLTHPSHSIYYVFALDIILITSGAVLFSLASAVHTFTELMCSAASLESRSSFTWWFHHYDLL